MSMVAFCAAGFFLGKEARLCGAAHGVGDEHEAIQRACGTLGYADVTDVRQGKLYYLRDLEGKKARIKEDLTYGKKA